MGYIVEKMYDPRLNACNRAWGKVKWIGLTPESLHECQYERLITCKGT